jgi:UDP-2,4-diacetamido-2,4,6-trideoxy-beta-L-altropyranose hydrolase
VIRADASVALGSGHVMRCLALADQVRKRGGAVRFVARELPGNLIPLLREKGYDTAVLPGRADVASPEWLDPHWQADAEDTLSACADAEHDWLIVDSYALDARWEASVRKRAARVMAIDDLANRPHDCDLLLDQNLNGEAAARYEPLVTPDSLRLIGPHYALLRPAFQEARRRARKRDGRVGRLLVSFGGAGPNEATIKSLAAVRELGRPDIAVDVVTGRGDPAALRDICPDLPQVTVHPAVEDMAGLMERADLSIGATGSTAWERCCLGLPAVVLTLAANQETNARELAALGCCAHLGRAEATDAGTLAAALRQLLAEPERVQAMSRAAFELVDGRGVQRVARLLDPAAIELRDARPEDSERVLEWRNAEVTRRYSHDPRPLSSCGHAAWFRDILQRTGSALLIGEAAGTEIGVLRYDFSGSECTVSVYLVPGQHGHGYGPRLLRAGHQWLRRRHPMVKRVRAEVHEANRSSVLAFRQAGYRQAGDVFVKDVAPV